ncbi:MAG: CoA transferase [Alphaproteobacteria bacterium]|nr:CoA transferase [Alphaproteobacteria bacterium]
MLKGLKVVEYATYHAAPGAGLILSDWGADVVKVEPPAGDPIRGFFGSIGVDSAVNPAFEFDNGGKRSVMIDTASEAGRATLRRMALAADVFLTNVRPGGLERSGLDPASLRALNPRLIYATVTGYGLDGPDADKPGFDIASFWARSGMAALHTPKGSDPFPIRTAMGDHTTSIATAAGILAALYERERTGEGRVVEASLLRTASFAIGVDLAIMMSFGRVASNRPRKGAVQPLANFFKTADDRWICLVPRQTGDEWKALRGALELDHLADDPRFQRAKERRLNAEALVEAIDAAFAKFTFAEATARLDAANLVWAPVQTAAEAVKDPQLHAAGGIVQTPSGPMPASPVRFPGVDQTARGAAPGPSEHARSALADYGFSAAEIDALIAEGAVKAG